MCIFAGLSREKCMENVVVDVEVAVVAAEAALPSKPPKELLCLAA